MKKYAGLFIALTLLLTGCQGETSNDPSTNKEQTNSQEQQLSTQKEVEMLLDDVQQLQKAEQAFQQTVTSYKSNKAISNITYTYVTEGVKVSVELQNTVNDEQAKQLAEEIYGKMTVIDKELPIIINVYRDKKLIFKK